MALNRRLLRELNIPGDAAESIMLHYRETVNALVRERDEALASVADKTALEARLAQAELARNESISAQKMLQQELDDIRDTEGKRLRRCALTEALDGSGANPAAIPLLIDRLMDDAADPIDAVNLMREQHPGLFAQPKILGVERINPPTEQSGPMTLEDVRRMNEDEIIKKWRAVEGALQHGERARPV